MSKIKILPDYLANQIAAGEVVQRPESVIKELVENAIDAEADQIFITIHNSGKDLIHIQDNGIGMSKEDLELSIKRHATSKLITQEDLEAILTFGFRGEALASISAVAKLEIRTKRRNDELGYCLISEPNREAIIEECDTEVGTQIFVKNLFYNVPARRKFLKSNLSEYKSILDTLNKFALSHKDVQLIFNNENNLVLNLRSNSLKERINEILGHRIIESMIKLDYDDGVIKITGYVAKPSIMKLSKAQQYLFLNNRSIQNKSISHAVLTAYGPLIDKNQYPPFVMFLEIDPHKVDINIHPQKHEVKFDDDRMIYMAVKNAVRNALQSNDLTASVAIKFDDDIELDNFRNPFEKTDDNRLVNRNTGEIIDFKRSNNDSDWKKSDNKGKFEERKNYNNFEKEERKYRPGEEKTAFDLIFNDDFKEIEKTERRFLQIHNKYILCQNEKGVLVIDQHNAHERINFERVIKKFEKGLSTEQTMLFAESFKLTNNEILILKEIEEEVRLLGFNFELEADELILIAKPIDVKNGAEEQDFKEILELYNEYQEMGKMNKRENIAASFSCRSSIKTGQNLSQKEMEQLYKDLFNCETPYVCPHGRPVILEMTITDLDKKFGRSPDYSFERK